MSPKLKKALLGVALAICLAVAGSRVYKFYQSTQPLAEPGECLQIVDEEAGAIKLHVVENHQNTHETDAIAELEPIPGLKIGVGVRIPYKDLREMGATKVSCE